MMHISNESYESLKQTIMKLETELFDLDDLVLFQVFRDDYQILKNCVSDLKELLGM